MVVVEIIRVRGRGRLSDTHERTTREQNDRLFSIETRRLILDIRQMSMRADIPGDLLRLQEGDKEEMKSQRKMHVCGTG